MREAPLPTSNRPQASHPRIPHKTAKPTTGAPPLPPQGTSAPAHLAAVGAAACRLRLALAHALRRGQRGAKRRELRRARCGGDSGAMPLYAVAEVDGGIAGAKCSPERRAVAGLARSRLLRPVGVAVVAAAATEPCSGRTKTPPSHAWRLSLLHAAAGARVRECTFRVRVLGVRHAVAAEQARE